jgi:cytidylate kinase
VKNEDDVIKVLPKTNVEFKQQQTFLNGVDVTDRIREVDVAKGSSVVAVYEKVRQDLVKKQKDIAIDLINKGKIVILDGRDIGTRVLPDADLKIFLTATVEVRAKRSLNRYKQKGIIKNLKDVLEETKSRDYRDSHRDIDPLPIKPESFGYWILDDSNQTEKETINLVLEKLRERGLIHDKN